MLLILMSLSHSIHIVGYTALEAWQSHPIPLCFLQGEERSTFPGSAPPYDTVYLESVVGIRHGDSNMVIRYQAGEFAHTMLAECFVALMHTYPGVTGRVTTLTHFPLKQGCEDYSLDQAVEDIEHGLDSILMDFVNS